MSDKYIKRLLPDIINNKISVGPSAAIININSVCNLNCEFCWIHSPLKKGRPEPSNVSFVSVKKILDELRNMGVNQISLSADGEPWLNPEITEIINYIKDNGFFLRITTNLTFDDKTIQIAFARADVLDVNLSAPNQRIYTKIHNPCSKNAYRNTINNLKVYANLYKKRSKPLLEINYVITQNNYNFLKEALALAEKLQVPNIRFRILDTIESTKKLFLKSNDLILLKQDIQSILSKKTKINHNLNELNNYLSDSGKITFELKSCLAGWVMVSIEYNGGIGLCCQHGNLIIGSWKKQSIEKCWYSQKANKLRKKMKDDFDIKAPFWKNCLFCCSEKINRDLFSMVEKYERYKNECCR